MSEARLLEDRQAGESVPARVLRLSEAIREGCASIPETRDTFCGCALGTGYRVRTGKNLHRAAYTLYGTYEKVAKEFGIPLSLAEYVSDMHFADATREQCADYLQAKGY